MNLSHHGSHYNRLQINVPILAFDRNIHMNALFLRIEFVIYWHGNHLLEKRNEKMCETE